MGYLSTYLILIFNLLSPASLQDRVAVDAAIAEYKQKIDSDVETMIVFKHTKKFQVRCVKSDKIILISMEYWRKLDATAKRVVILRELLHCEGGYPYMDGMSIMSRNLTMAITVYVYGT